VRRGLFGCHRALLCGPSTSPLESATRFDLAAKSTRLKSQGKDTLLDAAGSAHGADLLSASGSAGSRVFVCRCRACG
jgi:hypothetical protein